MRGARWWRLPTKPEAPHRPDSGPAPLPAVSSHSLCLPRQSTGFIVALNCFWRPRRHAPCMAGRAKMEEGLDQAEKPLAARTPRFGLGAQGMHHLGTVHWNLTAPYLYEQAVRRHEGQLGNG